MTQKGADAAYQVYVLSVLGIHLPLTDKVLRGSALGCSCLFIFTKKILSPGIWRFWELRSRPWCQSTEVWAPSPPLTGCVTCVTCVCVCVCVTCVCVCILIFNTYIHKYIYKWIFLLHTWNIVNQLYFNKKSGPFLSCFSSSIRYLKISQKC